MAIKNFERTPANVKSRIDKVDVNEYTGKVTIFFSMYDPRLQTAQVSLVQFLLSGGSWTNATIASESTVQKSTNITTKPRWEQHQIIWNAYDDVDLDDYTGVTVKIQVKDNGGTVDTARVSSAFTLNLLPIVDRITLPQSIEKDTTPVFEFEVPSAVANCNMHFQIKIATDSALTIVVQTIDSSSDQTGWMFELEGNYVDMKPPGCPDISALQAKAKCKFTVQTALSTEQTLYYEIIAKSVTKRVPVSQLNLTPAQMTGYPVNY